MLNTAGYMFTIFKQQPNNNFLLTAVNCPITNKSIAQGQIITVVCFYRQPPHPGSNLGRCSSNGCPLEKVSYHIVRRRIKVHGY
jgi:hypothetical protein